MSSSIKSQSPYERSVYVSLTSSFSTCLFHSMSFFNALQGRNETISQPDASMHTGIFRVENVCNAYLHYEQTLSNAIHYTSTVNLLQESVNFAVTYRNRAHFVCSSYVYHSRSPAFVTTLFALHRISVLPTRKYHRLLLKEKRNSVETWGHSATSDCDVVR